jgi:hypothetical protein
MQLASSFYDSGVRAAEKKTGRKEYVMARGRRGVVKKETVRYHPPRVSLSETEYLLPIVHSNRAELRAAARALNGTSFDVKVLDPTPEPIADGYMVMAKFKALRPSAADDDEAAPFKAEGKVTGQVLGVVEGIEVTANLQRAKRAGKDRVWFQIRQREPKRWRVSGNLSYARAVDVQFERD